MIVVSNTSPLISLYKVSCLDILKSLFGEIRIPKAVYDEIDVSKKDGKQIRKIINCDKWIKIEQVYKIEKFRSCIDKGEAEVLMLAKEIKADIVIIDNKEPREFAREYIPNTKIIGTIGIIIEAYRKGLIENPINKILELKEIGFYISEEMIRKIEYTIKR